MTKPANVKKGKKFWCVYRKLAMPTLGAVIALTDNSGKQIGVQFDEDINGHDCDGRGKDKHCLWLRPHHLYTEKEYKLVQKKFEEQALHMRRIVGKDIEVLG